MSQQVMGQEAFREWEARKRIYLRHVKAKEVQTSQKWNRLAEQKDQEKRLRVRQMKRSILEYRRYLFFLWCLCSLVCVVNVGRTVCSGADLYIYFFVALRSIFDSKKKK
jgi:hypothetical protein